MIGCGIRVFELQASSGDDGRSGRDRFALWNGRVCPSLYCRAMSMARDFAYEMAGYPF